MLITSPAYAKEMRLFKAGHNLHQKFLAIRTKLFQERLKINTQKTTYGILGKTIEVSVELFAYFWVVQKTFQGSISIGDMVIYFQAFQKGKTNLVTALNSFISLLEHKMFLIHIQDFMRLQPVLTAQTSSDVDLKTERSLISLEKVNFKYPTHSQITLKDISASFQKGQLTAIVGENGSGKSTLAKILCRLYDPESGQVRFGDEDIKTFNIHDYRGCIRAVFQDFGQYDFTVKENIVFGEEEEQYNEEFLKHSIEITDADKFIKAFDQGVDQKLGKLFAQGQQLSLGQWQKIAIARAFYKSSDILILDEPTSAIDPLAESKIFQALKEVAKDRIVILITHRLYNLKLADQVLVMKDGEIAEQGSHDALIERNGHYREMFEKQRV